MRIAVVILAAGEGRRMGGPKALLHVGASTFLARTAALLARPGVAIRIAVLGHEADRVLAESEIQEEVTIVRNPRYREGMLTSVLTGLEAAEAAGAEAVLLHPVDHPLVGTATVDRVVTALEMGAKVVVPSFQNRRGHPGGFARDAWKDLRGASPDRGARAVLADHPEWVVHVEGDAGCVAGVDTPEDYERHLR
ncbi:MAG TPA: nucleotidyltransferase family protein [Vicinamibacteria bacterium]|jgi:molybdenum cofactor cytidylyltransferase|nr:nucleotidyltransferase family protein [Vicinamibacteria bacterium]